MVYFPVIGFTLSERESYAPSGVKLPPPHDIATQTLPLHIGVAESVQSADAKHVVTTAAVATMVLPVKGTVKDIAVGSATGAVDSHCASRSRLDLPDSCSFPCHARKAGTTRRWCDPLPSWVKNRRRHHQCQAHSPVNTSGHGPP